MLQGVTYNPQKITPKSFQKSSKNQRKWYPNPFQKMIQKLATKNPLQNRKSCENGPPMEEGGGGPTNEGFRLRTTPGDQNASKVPPKVPQDPQGIDFR